jgi:hypothetical protein
MPEYINAQYIKSPFTKEITGISVDIDGVPSFAPIDLANTDYANIMQLVESGDLIIKPADEVNN